MKRQFVVILLILFYFVSQTGLVYASVAIYSEELKSDNIEKSTKLQLMKETLATVSSFAQRCNEYLKKQRPFYYALKMKGTLGVVLQELAGVADGDGRVVLGKVKEINSKLAAMGIKVNLEENVYEEEFDSGVKLKAVVVRLSKCVWKKIYLNVDRLDDAELAQIGVLTEDDRAWLNGLSEKRVWIAGKDTNMIAMKIACPSDEMLIEDLAGFSESKRRACEGVIEDIYTRCDLNDEYEKLMARYYVVNIFKSFVAQHSFGEDLLKNLPITKNNVSDVLYLLLCISCYSRWNATGAYSRLIGLTAELVVTEDNVVALLENCCRIAKSARSQSRNAFDISVQLLKRSSVAKEMRMGELTRIVEFFEDDDEFREGWFLISIDGTRRIREILEVLPQEIEALPVLETVTAVVDCTGRGANGALGFVASLFKKVPQDKMGEANVILNNALEELKEIAQAARFEPDSAFCTLGYAVRRLSKVSVTEDFKLPLLTKVKDKLADIDRAAGWHAERAFLVVNSVIQKKAIDVTEDNLGELLDKFVTPFQEMRERVGSGTGIACLITQEIINRIDVTLDDLDAVLNNCAVALGDISSAVEHGGRRSFYTLMDLANMFAAHHDYPLPVSKDNFAALLDKLARIAEAAGGATPEAYKAIDYYIKQEKIKDDEIVAKLDACLEPFQNLALATGPAAPQAFDAVRVYREKNYAAGKESLPELCEMLTESFREIVRKAGPAAAAAIQLTGVCLGSLNGDKADVVDFLDRLGDEIEEIVAIDKDSASSALLLVEEAIDKITVRDYNQIIAVVNELKGAVVEIVSSTDRVAGTALRFVQTVLKRTEVKDFKDVKDAIERLERKVLLIYKLSPAPLAAVVTFTVLANQCERAKNMNPSMVSFMEGKMDLVISVLRRDPDKVYLQLLEQEPTLKSIVIGDIGEAVNEADAVIKDVLMSVPTPDVRMPAWVPEMPDALGSVAEVGLDQLQENAGLGDLSFCEADSLGRSLTFVDDNGDQIIVKLLRNDELDSVLAYEARWLETLRGNLDLRHEPPMPIRINELDDFRFKFDLDGCGLETKQRILLYLERFSAESVSKVGRRLEVSSEYIAMAYKVDKESRYNSCLNFKSEPDWQGFSTANFDAAYDLGVMARYGIVHTALADLFHRLTGGDGRRYMATFSLSHLFGRGAGRITAWPLAVQHINLGADGVVRDYAELTHLSRIVADDGVLGSDAGFIQEQFGDKRANFYLLELLSEYTICLTLNAGLWFEENGWPDWEDEERLADLADFMRGIYISLLDGYLGEEYHSQSEDFTELVNWQRYARQMAVVLSDVHAEFLDPQVRRKTKVEFLKKIFGAGVDVGFASYQEGSWDSERGFISHQAELEHIKNQKGIGPVGGPSLLQEMVTAYFRMFGLGIAQAALEQDEGYPSKLEVDKLQLNHEVLTAL